MRMLLPVVVSFLLVQESQAFAVLGKATDGRPVPVRLAQSSETVPASIETVEDATQLLIVWDRCYNPDTASSSRDDLDDDSIRPKLAASVRLLNQVAREEREKDAVYGRCMLGICASSAEEGVATLKSWVTGLELPRGLLHGMDKDGVPLDLDGGVYIKYNTGGVFTFADIRKSGVGFDALWRPGDALLEPYDGKYRGVYFQVELSDQEFRQFLVPLDIFDV